MEYDLYGINKYKNIITTYRQYLLGIAMKTNHTNTNVINLLKFFNLNDNCLIK